MAWKKTFDQTPDGRFLFRPGGQFGRTYQLPDKAAFDRARLVSWGMMFVVFAFAVANIIHRQNAITLIAAVVILVAYFVWLGVAKKNWTVAKEG